MPREWRTDQRIPQFQLCLCQIGFTHGNRSDSAFVSRFGIIKIQLTGGILCIQRFDTFKITLCFQCLCLVFLQLSPGFICFSPILLLVNDKKYLILIYVSTFGKKHLFQIPFYPGTYLYKLLGTDTAYILTINFYIVFCSRFYHDRRNFRFSLTRPGQYPINA